MTVGGGEAVHAFVPRPLPPVPEIDFGEGLRRPLEAATTALGRLDAVTELLPDATIFVYGYVRKEAVLSSQIEGTQSSLADLLLHEAGGVPRADRTDVLETSNAVTALHHGVERLRDGFPLSNRLMREMHAKLLASGRGAAMTPGVFRRSQNWIGGSRPGNAAFVPPPPNHVEECMAALERFIHATDDGLPILVKAGLAHVQFETIHPFLDGNGRLGRLLITLMLCDAGLLREPLLYLSLYLQAQSRHLLPASQRHPAHRRLGSVVAVLPRRCLPGSGSSCRNSSGREQKRTGTTDRKSASRVGARVRHCACTNPSSKFRLGAFPILPSEPAYPGRPWLPCSGSSKSWISCARLRDASEANSTRMSAIWLFCGKGRKISLGSAARG